MPCWRDATLNACRADRFIRFTEHAGVTHVHAHAVFFVCPPVDVSGSNLRVFHRILEAEVFVTIQTEKHQKNAIIDICVTSFCS